MVKNHVPYSWILPAFQRRDGLTHRQQDELHSSLLRYEVKYLFKFNVHKFTRLHFSFTNRPFSFMSALTVRHKHVGMAGSGTLSGNNRL